MGCNCRGKKASTQRAAERQQRVAARRAQVEAARKDPNSVLSAIERRRAARK